MNSFFDILNSSILSINRVGFKSAELLHNACNGKKIIDLLLFAPYKIVVRDIVNDVRYLEDGKEILTNIKVLKIIKQKNSVTIRAALSFGEINLIYFYNSGKSIVKSLKVGQGFWVSGKINLYKMQYNLVHPNIYPNISCGPNLLPHYLIYEPQYSKSSGMSSKRLNCIIADIFDKLEQVAQPNEWNLRAKEFNWPSFLQALKILHFPKSKEDIGYAEECKKRLAYDEIFIQQLCFLAANASKTSTAGIPYIGTGKITKQIKKKLGFDLTKDQCNSLKEIEIDQASNSRMFRILYGDVGSGKTLVALLAGINAIENNMQVAFLVPTEILAFQHYNKIANLLNDLDINVTCLSSTCTSKQREKIETDLSNNKIHLIIGTHSLFQNRIKYANLGLIIIDEQQRFGVEQRRLMFAKNIKADILMISATPIPRTVQMIQSNFASCSTILSFPKSRGKITTYLYEESKALGFLKKLSLSEKAKKIIWICPLIEPSKTIDLVSIQQRLPILSKLFNVGIIHGKIGKEQREKIIGEFTNGTINLLLSTTVVEVGVDIPDVDCMIIDDASHFGLSQIHQCRGRVARGIQEGMCFLVYRNKHASQKALHRLKVIRDNINGFDIAEYDLIIRGHGDVLGTMQSGFFDYKFFDPIKHSEIAKIAIKDAGKPLAECNVQNIKDACKIFDYNLFSLYSE